MPNPAGRGLVNLEIIFVQHCKKGKKTLADNPSRQRKVSN